MLNHMPGKTEQVVIRIEPKLLREAESVVRKMGRTGEKPSRASVLRSAIRIGLKRLLDNLRQ